MSRRIGAARNDFDTLARIWSHSSLSSERKIKIYEACVMSKLLYCLHTSWLKTPELARLDAFHAKCLRRILGIPHSYVSRISNSTVLQSARARKLSTTLLERQLLLFAHVGRKGDNDPIRNSTFKPSSTDLRDLRGNRGRGRPRLTWSREVHKHAVEVCKMNSLSMSVIMEDGESSVFAWLKAVQHYISSL